MRGTLEERFWPKVAKADVGCWEWTAGRSDHGYGVIGTGTRAAPRQNYAHRVAYELAVGPIPEGLQIDHLCGNKGCVRPDHLEPVTQRENLLRGDTVPARNAAKTHCPYGHSYADAYRRRAKDGTVTRRCRTCEKERDARRARG